MQNFEVNLQKRPAADEETRLQQVCLPFSPSKSVDFRTNQPLYQSTPLVVPARNQSQLPPQAVALYEEQQAMEREVLKQQKIEMFLAKTRQLVRQRQMQEKQEARQELNEKAQKLNALRCIIERDRVGVFYEQKEDQGIVSKTVRWDNQIQKQTRQGSSQIVSREEKKKKNVEVDQIVQMPVQNKGGLGIVTNSYQFGSKQFQESKHKDDEDKPKKDKNKKDKKHDDEDKPKKDKKEKDKKKKDKKKKDKKHKDDDEDKPKKDKKKKDKKKKDKKHKDDDEDKPKKDKKKKDKKHEDDDEDKPKKDKKKDKKKKDKKHKDDDEDKPKKDKKKDKKKKDKKHKDDNEDKPKKDKKKDKKKKDKKKKDKKHKDEDEDKPKKDKKNKDQKHDEPKKIPTLQKSHSVPLSQSPNFLPKEKQMFTKLQQNILNEYTPIGLSPKLMPSHSGKIGNSQGRLSEEELFSGVGLGLTGKGIGTPQQNPKLPSFEDNIPSLSLTNPTQAYTNQYWEVQIEQKQKQSSKLPQNSILKSIDEKPQEKTQKQLVNTQLPLGVTLVLNDYQSAINALNPDIKTNIQDFQLEMAQSKATAKVKASLDQDFPKLWNQNTWDEQAVKVEMVRKMAIIQEQNANKNKPPAPDIKPRTEWGKPIVSEEGKRIENVRSLATQWERHTALNRHSSPPKFGENTKNKKFVVLEDQPKPIGYREPKPLTDRAKRIQQVRSMTAAWERNVAVNRNPSPDMFTFEDYDQNSPFAGVKSIEEKKDQFAKKPRLIGKVQSVVSPFGQVKNQSPERVDLKKQREEREKLLQRKADMEKVNKLISQMSQDQKTIYHQKVQEISKLPLDKQLNALQLLQKEAQKAIESRRNVEQQDQGVNYTQRHLELVRYTAAMKSLVRDKMKETYQEDIPCICTCGALNGKKGVHHPFQCANNCPFYERQQEYQKAVSEMIASFQGSV